MEIREALTTDSLPMLCLLQATFSPLGSHITTYLSWTETTKGTGLLDFSKVLLLESILYDYSVLTYVESSPYLKTSLTFQGS